MKVPILGWTIDERFLAYRRRSTSIGGMAGLLLAAGLFFHHLFLRDTIDWELFSVIATVAVVKLAVMAWFYFTD